MGRAEPSGAAVSTWSPRSSRSELNASGQYLAAAPLHPTATATSVRVRDGKRLVTDGPFAETREQLGGYFLIDAKDLDEAIGIAAGFQRRAWAPSKSGRCWKACRRSVRATTGSALHVRLFLAKPHTNGIYIQRVAKSPWPASITWIALPNKVSLFRH